MRSSFRRPKDTLSKATSQSRATHALGQQEFYGKSAALTPSYLMNSGVVMSAHEECHRAPAAALAGSSCSATMTVHAGDGKDKCERKSKDKRPHNATAVALDYDDRTMIRRSQAPINTFAYK